MGQSLVSPKPTAARIKVFSEALHRGESQSDAYRLMNPVSKNWKPETVHVRACQWAKLDKVKAKVEQLQEESAERSKTTVATIDEMHRRAFEVAEQEGQAAAMTSAAMNLAKLHGLIIDRSKQEVKHSGVVEVPLTQTKDEALKGYE